MGSHFAFWQRGWLPGQSRLRIRLARAPNQCLGGPEGGLVNVSPGPPNFARLLGFDAPCILVSARIRSSFDVLSRLTKASVYKGSGLHTYLYSYDGYGNLTQRLEDYNSGTFSSLKDYLTRQTDGGLGLSGVDGYIAEVMFSATVATTGSMKNNRLGAVTRGGTIGGKVTGITPQTSPTVVYDPNGNVTNDGQYVYKYDCLNRQVAVYLINGTTKVAEYFYDPAG